MLEATVNDSVITALIDRTFSVEQVGIFKPDSRVYRMAVDGLYLRLGEIVFQSSNARDAAGASAYG